MDKKETFIAAIKNNEKLLLKIASVYTNNTEDKNDLIQEIIYQLWRSFDSFNQQSSLSTWIYRVALNVSIYHLKVSKRKVLTVPLEEHGINYPDLDATNSEEKWALFKQQIDNLNLLDKAIVLLYLDNKNYNEISEIIGITPSNVGTKLNRIKEKLKSKIAKQL